VSSINATAGSPTQPTALISSGDNTATLVFQTNSTTALSIDTSQNANCTSTGAITIPAGTTNNRPTGVNGMIRYNSSTANLEAYLSGAWVTFP
jgi:hypothetical protein